ncbi:carbohydrate ABC transporter permease [Dictyobacter kobayashii]|uniref:carbohydrate ABC transporter permease n=1 Tax=Dictyobacter kobayashii TaxID=2014872 RepID=UPI001C3FBED0|nr:carbohydrate ABC transporter permease [Dictyobacter kobayashii]
MKNANLAAVKAADRIDADYGQQRLLVKRQYRIRNMLRQILIYVLLCVVTLIVIIPFLWMVSTSLKTTVEASTYPPSILPSVPQWHNYADVFNAVPFLTYLLNSILYASAITIGQLFCCSLSAYAFSRLTFPGRNKLFIVYLATMLIPGAVTLVPSFIMMKTFGWLDSYLAIIVPGIFGSAFGTFLLRQFMYSIPRELDEAATLDGASKFRIYWQIILPLSRSALTVLAVTTIMNVWNDFVWPLVMLQSDSVTPLTMGLSIFTSNGTEQFNNVPLNMAASTMTVAPLIIIFLFAQRHFIRGIAVSGLGGR